MAVCAGILVLSSTALAQRTAIPVPEIPDILPLSDTVILRVYDSTLDKAAAALIVGATLRGRHRFGPCDPNWALTVEELRFRITRETIRVTGQGKAKWCDVSTDVDIETEADVALQTTIVFPTSMAAAPGTGGIPPIGPGQRRESIAVTIGGTSVRPTFRVFGQRVTLPPVNVGSVLTLPPLPINPALIDVETATGPTTLRLSPSQTTLVKRDNCTGQRNCVELRTKLQLF